MEKIKLSTLIYVYKKKSLQKEELFEGYFEEKDIEEKLKKLEIMYEKLGDISMPIDYFKTFIYAGLHDKHFILTNQMISDIYDVIKYYDDMPVTLIDKLLVYYDEECFKEFDVKGYIHGLIKQYKYSKKTEKMYIDYMDEQKTLITEMYEKESEKLDSISDQYAYGFIQYLKDIVKSRHIKYEDIIKILPKDSFFKVIWNCPNEYMAKYSDYMFIYKLLTDEICLDEYTDDEQIPTFEYICQTKQGIQVQKMYTTFTKKEYLDEITKEKVKKIRK